VKRPTALLLGLLAGAALGAFVAGRRRPAETGQASVDAAADDLRRKLEESREAAAAPPPAAPPPPPAPTGGPPAPRPEPPARPPSPPEPPPADEFEAMRRRVHEEGRAAAEQMRRSADPPEQG
jgi:hypothetical protein